MPDSVAVSSSARGATGARIAELISISSCVTAIEMSGNNHQPCALCRMRLCWRRPSRADPSSSRDNATSRRLANGRRRRPAERLFIDGIFLRLCAHGRGCIGMLYLLAAFSWYYRAIAASFANARPDSRSSRGGLTRLARLLSSAGNRRQSHEIGEK